MWPGRTNVRTGPARRGKWPSFPRAQGGRPLRCRASGSKAGTRAAQEKDSAADPAWRQGTYLNQTLRGGKGPTMTDCPRGASPGCRAVGPCGAA
eukprot:12239505-Alexandrium_andersonii.AAC.1